ncbi:hypothetical protein D3C71_852670 [compost metagenome]
MKFSILFGFLLILLVGCNESNKNNSFHLEEKALSFTTDFPAYNLHYVTDSNHTEFVSFADFVTAKKISFHSIDTKARWSIDLKELMKSERGRFISYFPITPDSIVLLSGHTNKIYLINRKAKILKKIDQSKLLVEGVEFGPPIYFEKNQLYCAIHHYPIKNLKTKNDLKKWDAEYLKKTIIAKILINFHDSMSLNLGTNLISRFMKKNQLPAEGTHFFLNKSKIYYYSAYGDTLYSITENGNIPLLKIKSTIGKIHVTASTREQYNKNTNCINEAYLKQSFICDILFDNKRNLIYVFVRKPKNEKYFPFNILVYDKNFKKLNELEFDGKKYYTSGFVGEEGLYLLRNYNKRPNQKLFDLLSYEK